MPDLFDSYSLADLGQASVMAFWAPLVAWTLIAGVAELALRLTRTHALAAVRVRSALLLTLPLALLAPSVLSTLLPDAAHAVAAVRPSQLALPEVAVVLQPATPAPAPIGWVLVGLATLGVLGAGLVGLVRWIGALLRLRRVRASLRTAPEPVQALVTQTGHTLGLRQPVEAVECASGIAPFTFGWRRPVVAVPPTLTGEPLRLAIAHELAHIRHRDFVWNTLEQGVAAIGLAHPLVRVIARSAVLGREQAADAAVLAASPTDRRPYADLLLSYASLPAPSLTLGATRGSSILHSRIAAMKRPLSPTRLRQLVVAGRVLGLLAAVLLVGGAATLAVPDAPVQSPEWLEGQVTDASTQ
ncbi:MAG: M56 family metallopeptidase, partial [Bacteroidota bacterium]